MDCDLAVMIACAYGYHDILPKMKHLDFDVRAVYNETIYLCAIYFNQLSAMRYLDTQIDYSLSTNGSCIFGKTLTMNNIETIRHIKLFYPGSYNINTISSFTMDRIYELLKIRIIIKKSSLSDFTYSEINKYIHQLSAYKICWQWRSYRLRRSISKYLSSLCARLRLREEILYHPPIGKMLGGIEYQKTYEHWYECHPPISDADSTELSSSCSDSE